MDAPVRSLLLTTIGLVALLALVVVAVPYALVLALLLLGATALGKLRTREPAEPSAPPRDLRGASLMILNWNGKEFLARLLPSVRAAVEHDGGDHEVIVIDNGSTDGSVEFVREHFPEVRIVRHATNLMFVRGYDEALSAGTRDVLVLLNNDMVLDAGFLRPLLAPFTDPAVFAVSGQIFFADPTKRREETGLCSGRLAWGLVKLAHDPVAEDALGLRPTLWAGGGSSAVDRRRFVALGGFDRLYDPFYYEDTALGLEAWKRGWSVLMAPEAKVVHAHRGTSGTRLARAFVARRRIRNGWLFTWRHFDSLWSTLATTLLAPLNVARLALRERDLHLPAAAWLHAGALAMTAARLPLLLRQRFLAPGREVRSEREVLDVAFHRHRFARVGGRIAPSVDRPLRLLMLMARLPRLATDGSWAQFEILKALGKRHHVTVFALLERDDLQQDVDRLRPHVARLETMPLEKAPRRSDLHHQVPERLWSDYSGEAVRERVAQLLRSEEYDAVQVDYVEMAHVVHGLCRGLPVVHVCHEPLVTIAARAPAQGPFGALGKLFARMHATVFERATYREFARVVCLSDADAAVLARTVPGLPLRVVKNGLDLTSLRPAATPPRRPVVTFVGYYGHTPNLDAARWLAEEIFPRVRTQVPDAELWLVGKGAAEELATLAKVPGVVVKGFVADLAGCLAESAVFAAPLRQGGGLRSKVLEAMAYGKAVVATSIGAAGVGAKSGSEILVADDATGFAAAVVGLLSDPSRRSALELAARARAESDFSIERTAREYEAVYRELAP